ncbi:MAG TPA: hypothetical protein VF303_01180 [Candidatus Nanoarchaeia archaeon]
MSLLDIFFGRKRTVEKRGLLGSFDRDQIQVGWQKIEELKNVGKPSTFREAVVEADKLVDFSLDKLFPGRENAAERLKETKEIFKFNREDYENLWYAHKLRNEIVHKVGFELPSVEAKRLLDYFKKALETLGAL